MNLPPSPEHEQLVTAVRAFLAREAPLERLFAQKGEIGGDVRLWLDFGELGFLAVGLDEKLGGVGLGAAEEALVYRELGRHLISPGVFGLTLGARLAAQADNDAMLEAIVSGAARVALASPLGAAELGEVSSGEFHLLECREAAWAIVWSPSGSGLFRTGDFIGIEDIPCIDRNLVLERGRLDHAEAVVWCGAETDPVHDSAQLLIAAYAVGVAEACQDLAAECARVREKFGGPIGSSLTVNRQRADTVMLAEAAWSETASASSTFSADRQRPSSRCVAARVLAINAALRAATTNINLQSELGFTADGESRLYLERAHLMDRLGGDLRASPDDLFSSRLMQRA